MISTVATWAARAAAAVLPDVVGRLHGPTNTVYLTFDDGPSDHTLELLTLLDDVGARATFFLRGDRAEQLPAVVQQILRHEHGLGNHSFHHLDAWRHRWPDVRTDLERGDDAIAFHTGSPPLWVRPPFGRFRPATLKWCRNRRRKMALWDVLAGDFLPDASSQKITDEVIRLARPGSLLVLHDGNEQQPRAMASTERVLRKLVRYGWSLDRLPDSDSVVTA